eukprot:6208999-Pyramimonas_sp.AAC.1
MSSPRLKAKYLVGTKHTSSAPPAVTAVMRANKASVSGGRMNRSSKAGRTNGVERFFPPSFVHPLLRRTVFVPHTRKLPPSLRRPVCTCRTFLSRGLLVVPIFVSFGFWGSTDPHASKRSLGFQICWLYKE